MIHHYTSIQNLALILKSKTIRFTRLDLVDDIKEIAGLPKNFGTYVFISCWTEEEKENIALWKMYTDNMKGVRISMPQQMFRKFKFEPGEYEGFQVVGNNVESPVPIEETFGNDYFVAQPPNLPDGFYKKIIYDDDYEKKYKALFSTKANGITVDGIHHLGKYKDPMWEFQKESRFSLCIFPMAKLNNSLINYNKEKQMDSIGPLIVQQQPTSLKYFDVLLDECILDNICIRLGPFCQPGDKIIIESLLKEYTTNGSVEESHLSRVIRRL